MSARPDDEAAGPGDGPADAGLGDDVAGDPRVQAGLEHLQRAAREVIAASRAFLDVAEELVEEPRAAGGLVDLLGGLVGPDGLGALAGRAGRARGRGPDRHDHDDPDDPDDDPPVQRIPVS